MNKYEANEIVLNKYGIDEYISQFIKIVNNKYIFLLSRIDKESIPNKIIVAIDNDTKKIGASIYSEQEAIKGSM